MKKLIIILAALLIMPSLSLAASTVNGAGASFP